uniref:Protein kinase domain-containing protein n=1 Tax=Trichuris muris TaxID=70415 RepID=A0A5S6QZJ6_TRIMR
MEAEIAEPLTIEVGQVINNWRVTKELGRGTYGAVFQVVNDVIQRDAAMKVERRSIGPEYRMLKIEVAVMGELRNKNSKNCVQLIDHGCTPTFNYMVMNLVGSNLESLAKKIAKLNNKSESKFSPYTAFAIGISTLDTLCDLHKNLFLHRDVKPANFAIGCRASDLETIYLLDFGTTRRYAKQSGLHHRPRAKGPKSSGRYLVVAVYVDKSNSGQIAVVDVANARALHVHSATGKVRSS